MRTPALPVLAASAVLVLALAGCSGDPAPEPSVRPSGAASAPGDPSASAAPAPTPATAAPAVETPVECESVDLSSGTVAGSDLGPCIQAVLVRYDSGTLTISGDELAGTVVYHYDPMFEFRGDLETGAGPASISFVDGVMLLDDGNGPVVADVDASEPAQQEAGATAEIYRVLADPGFIGDLIGGSDSWRVSAAPESVETPDGAVDAYRIESTAAYSWYDIPVDAYTLWLTEDYRPVAAESTTGFLGRTATLTQQLSGLGEPVSITPLS
ncbi:hypothetical protein ACIGEP_14145 [Microbacterium sp. NPDC077663]|uniref:hypothetical protein n=1 Tax=Microbacterium sp. NPDC077663 TaxID=3364189 RepID=UPI0037CBD4AA